MKTKQKKVLVDLLQIVQTRGALRKRYRFTEDEGIKLLKVAAKLQECNKLLASCKRAMKADKRNSKGVVQTFADGLFVDAAMEVEAKILSQAKTIDRAMELKWSEYCKSGFCQLCSVLWNVCCWS